MYVCGKRNQPAKPAARAAPDRQISVDWLEGLPGALVRLARMIADSRHLQPITVRRIAAEHARTVLMLADVLARRDSVPGATAPRLRGVPSELRAHADTLGTLRATVRGLRSATAEDPRPMQQLREIRRRLRREDRRMRGQLTDQDLHAVVASLRPALWVGPACTALSQRTCALGRGAGTPDTMRGSPPPLHRRPWWRTPRWRLVNQRCG